MSYESLKYCIGDLYAHIAMNVKKSVTFMRSICGHWIFENGLLKFKIENDVSIAQCSF
jgi:hypothetical protein